MSEFRSNLRTWVQRARAGDDVVVTEHGIPVARLVAVDADGVLERLEHDGIIARPKTATRPRSTVRSRVTAKGSVSELVTELRR